MRNLRKILFVVFWGIFVLFLHQFSNAQNAYLSITESSSENIRVPEAPGKGMVFESLEDEVAFRAYKALRRAGLYDISVGIAGDISLDDMDSTSIDGLLSDYKNLRGYMESMILTVTNFSQTAVAPDDSSYFSFSGKHQIFRASTEKVGDEYTNNIRTDISVFMQIVDIDLSRFLGSFEVDVINIGGNRAKSKARALKKLENKLVYELKWFYWLSYDIYQVKDGQLFSSFETNYPIRKGMIFEIVEPDRIWTTDGEETLVRGGRAGFAALQDTLEGGTQLKILRQWRPIYPESWTVECPEPIYGIQTYLIPPSTREYIGFGVQFHALPLKKLDWGGGIKLLMLTDSSEEDNFGLGFNGFGLWRFSRSGRMNFGVKSGLDLDIAFKKDDAEQVVSAALFSGNVGLYSEFLLTSKTDFVCEIGYRLCVETDSWNHGEDDNNEEAYWENVAPKLNNSGLVLSFGIKFYLF